MQPHRFSSRVSSTGDTTELSPRWALDTTREASSLSTRVRRNSSGGQRLIFLATREFGANPHRRSSASAACASRALPNPRRKAIEPLRPAGPQQGLRPLGSGRPYRRPDQPRRSRPACGIGSDCAPRRWALPVVVVVVGRRCARCNDLILGDDHIKHHHRKHRRRHGPRTVFRCELARTE